MKYPIILAAAIFATSPVAAMAASCTIQFGDDRKTYPFSVNLDEGRATRISFDKKNIPATSFIRSTEGPCTFTIFNDFNYKSRFVSIGTGLKNRIRNGTDGVRYRGRGLRSTLTESIKQNNEAIFDLARRIAERYIENSDEENSNEGNGNEENSKIVEKYITAVRTAIYIISGGDTWRARSVIIQLVPTTCSITVGGNSRSLTYHGAPGDKFNSVPAVDFIRKTSSGCRYKVYNETGFRKGSKTYDGGIKDKKRVGFRLRSLEMLRP